MARRQDYLDRAIDQLGHSIAADLRAAVAARRRVEFGLGGVPQVREIGTGRREPTDLEFLTLGFVGPPAEVAQDVRSVHIIFTEAIGAAAARRDAEGARELARMGMDLASAWPLIVKELRRIEQA